VPYLSLACSKIWDKSLESHRQLPFVHSIFHFGFPLPVPWPNTWGFRCRPISAMSAVTFLSLGIVDNVGVAVGIASLTLSVQLLLPLPASTSGFVAHMLGFRCRRMSGRVGCAIFESGIVENVVVAVLIASLTLSIQLLFPLPVSTSGSVADIRVSDGGRCRAVSAVPYLGRARSKMWGSRWNRFSSSFR